MKERPDYRLHSWENSGYLDETTFLLCSDIVLQTKIWKRSGGILLQEIFNFRLGLILKLFLGDWYYSQSWTRRYITTCVPKVSISHSELANGDVKRVRDSMSYSRDSGVLVRILVYTCLYALISLHNTLSWSCGKLIWWEVTSREVDLMGVDLVGGHKLHYDVQFLRII